VHYRRSDWPTSTCLGEIARAVYDGPTSVPDAIARCERLRTEAPDRAGRANVEMLLGGLLAQRGDFDEARALVGSAAAAFDDLGQRPALHDCRAALGEVEALAGDLSAAVDCLTEVCAEFERIGAYSYLASRAGDLAEVLYAQGRVDEAASWTEIAEQHSATDDLDARVIWLPVRAKLLACSGRQEDAETLALEAVRLAGQSDALNRRARVQCDFGEVLRIGGRADGAAAAFDRAIELYEQKGNVVGVARARALRDDLALV
jgi:tetratricopeptide (TPR) repeat protein